MSDTFDIYEWNNSQRQLSLKENMSLSEINRELLAVLFEAKQLAQQSTQLAQQNPDQALPNFADEVADKLDGIKSIILGE